MGRGSRAGLRDPAGGDRRAAPSPAGARGSPTPATVPRRRRCRCRPPRRQLQHDPRAPHRRRHREPATLVGGDRGRDRETSTTPPPPPPRPRRGSSATGAGSPGPLSVTSTRARVRSPWPWTSTTPPPCSIAFAIRLPVTCASRRRSPHTVARIARPRGRSSTPCAAAVGRQASTLSDTNCERSIASGGRDPRAASAPRRGRRAQARRDRARGRSRGGGRR